MSNQARLILLSGTGGSGTTSLAVATVAAAQEEGLRAVFVDAVDPEISEDVRASSARLLNAITGGLAADPLPDGAWTGLPSLRLIAAWTQVVAALEQPRIDVVVVDCGSLREARSLVEFPTHVRRLLDAALTPTLAMRGPATDGSAPSPFDVVTELRDRAAEIAALIEDDRTTMRLVTVPEADPVGSSLGAQATFALLGVQVEAIIVNRFARKSEGRGREALADQLEQLQRVEQGASGTWVWKSTSSLRPVPKDRSVIGPFGGVVPLRQADLVARAEDETYELSLPLVGEVAQRARVGRCGDDVVVDFDGIQRWLRLPSVLRRCRAVEATRGPDGLSISFIPDASLWRTVPDPEQVA